MKISIFAIALIIFMLSKEALADSFNIGIGGTYTQISLPSSTSSDISTYRGPGYILDARLKIVPVSLRKIFSFDLFLDLGQGFTKNIGASDSQQQDYTIGGIDIYYNSIFIGAQYGRAHSSVRASSGTYSNFNYDVIGPRVGVKIFGGDNFGMTLAGIYQTGTAAPAADNNLTMSQKVNQFSAILMFNFKLIGDRSTR
ncbi:MAG: hypothetical protein IT289_04840 [Oligoflexia bacterium]|nr:hypothetical protein [Oligoflexia bacterium]